jgi:hypothetical protein
MEFPLRLLIVEDGEADAELMIGALLGCAKSRSSTALSPIEEM